MTGERKRIHAGIIYADCERSALGTRSRVAKDLAGKKVLRRTVERLSRAKRLDEIAVFCPAGQVDIIGALIKETGAVVVGLQQPVGISARITRRKWALTSWRGGIGEATQFDEQMFTGEMLARMRDRGYYSVFSVPAEAVVLDAQLVDEMVEHHEEHGDEMRFTFTQAAPGLSGCMYRLDLLGDLTEARKSVGDLLAYDPDTPHADYIVQECAYKVKERLYGSEFRYIADTERSWAGLEKLLAGMDDESSPAEQIVMKMEDIRTNTEKLPREVVIEISGESSLRTKGYPHRQGNCGRGMMNLDIFEKIVKELVEYDDLCLTLGGCGEPLAHPELVPMIEAAKAAGIFGINIETDGRRLKGDLAERLRGAEVDTICVYLDANSAEVYEKVKGQGGYDELAGQVEDFLTQRNGGRPIVVPILVKTRETMGEMEAFYDRWIRQGGCAVIEGYNDFAGQIADRSVMNMAPPKRAQCRRLAKWMTILADGTVTICGQDYQGEGGVGNVKEKTVEALWRSGELEDLRRAQSEGRYEVNNLCSACREWHR